MCSIQLHDNPSGMAGRRICRVLCLIWGLQFSVDALAAGRVQYHIDSWTTENGLPQNVIRDICQSPDGYLWLATMDGLVRFDGVRFTVFNRSNMAGIAGNRFTSLLCLANGDIWAGTETSGLTQYHQGAFKTYTTLDGLPSDDIYDVIGDDDGRVWALARYAIVSWNPATSRLQRLTGEDAEYRYFGDKAHCFWGTDGDHVLLFKKGKFYRYLLPSEWPRGSLKIFGDDISGEMFVTNDAEEFAELNNEGRFAPVFGSDKQVAKPEANFRQSRFRDRQGELWNVDTRYDKSGSLVQSLIVPTSGQPEAIEFNSLFEDQEGSIWLATDGHGLYRLRRQTISVLSVDEGLPDRNVYPILQDHAGSIWIGTWSGGLARYNAGKIATYTKAQGLSSNRINAIYEDRSGVLWVSCNAGGVYRMVNGRFEAVSSELLQERGETRVIFQDQEGTLWFGTGGGLIRHKADRWSVITTKDGLPTDDARVIVPARGGGIWVGGYGGLARVSDQKIERWTEKDGLPSNSIRSLYEDNDGVLWIGTYDGGLGRFAQGRFTRYRVKDGLFNNGVFQILEDARGYFWMSCNRGIYRVARKELTDFANGQRQSISSIAYGKNDGMLNAECNGGLWPAGIRARDGTLWFPTQDGVAVISPEGIQANLRPPPVVIESVYVDRESIPLDQAVRIQPGKQNLDIDYTALSFIDSNQIQFKYKLEGLDSDWVDASTRRTAYYSHLAPGKYIFHVTAANSDGVWNTQGKQISIAVLPRFYQTWWFILGSMSAMTAALYLAWRTRVIQYKKAKVVQEEFSRQLIASQEQERKRIAGELHDSLGQHLLIIKNWAGLALRRMDGLKSLEAPLEEISNAASLAINEVRGIAYNLRPYQLERLGLTIALRDLVSQVEASSSIRFTLRLDELGGAFSKEVEIGVYRIVQECLNNIVRHSQATEAWICVVREPRVVRLSIDDNGRGFFPSQGRTAPAGKGGFGLIGIAERVRMSGGQFSVQSAPGAGTKISISIKLLEVSAGSAN